MEANRMMRLRYEFDNFMAKGGKSFFIILFVLFICGISLVAMLRLAVLFTMPNSAGAEGTLFQHMWTIFLEMTDPGNMGEDSGSATTLKVTAVVAGVFGVVIFSMLIAFITAQVDRFLAEHKKGRSPIVESGHTLILGWNERAIGIIRELIVANESESYASVVVLSDMEKEAMDDFMSESIEDTKSTRIVTRSGSTTRISDLKLVNACEAKSAIILSQCSDAATHEEKQNSDLRVIKTILALTSCFEGGKKIPIVADVFSDTHKKLADLFPGDGILSIDTADVLGKIMVQTSRSSGLAFVYDDILSFDGSELYLYKADWNNVKFADAIFRFDDGIVLGIRKPNGKLMLNPTDKNTTLAKGDEVVIFAEDNSTVDFKSAPVVSPKASPLPDKRLEKKTEHELFLGWHSIAPILIREFGKYLMRGSSINIAMKEPSDHIKSEIDKIQAEHPELKMSITSCDPLVYEELTRLNPFEYDNVIILSTSEGESAPEKADSETLMISLLLRRIRKETEKKDAKTSIITQIMSSENVELIEQTNVNDFIISNKLVSMMFSMISEQPGLKAVYDDLFSEEGSEVYLKPAWLYFDKLPVELTFADIMATVLQRNEICFGLRSAKFSHDADKHFGILLNPKKSQKFKIEKNDTLVVLAENEL